MSARALHPIQPKTILRIEIEVPTFIEELEGGDNRTMHPELDNADNDVDENDDESHDGDGDDDGEEIMTEDGPTQYQSGSDDDDDDDDDDAEKDEEEQEALGDDVASSSSAAASASGVGEKSQHASIQLGGPNSSKVPAYALLVGLLLTDDSTPATTTPRGDIISIPITRLPVTLGKEHVTKDASFIGLKDDGADQNNNNNNNNNSAHKLSQSMCCIFYRDARGGKLGLYKRGRKKDNSNNKNCSSNDGAEEGGGGDETLHDDPFDGMIYKPYHEQQYQDEDETVTTSPDDILRPPGMESKASLPPCGFFAIECTGRKIIVDKRELKKGQCAMLQNRSTIQIASYHFYFLLPNNTNIKSSPLRTMKVNVMKTTLAPASASAAAASLAVKIEKIKSKSAIIDGKNDDDEDSTNIISPPSKKARTSSTAAAVAAADDDDDEELDEDESNLNQSSPTTTTTTSSALYTDDQSDIELLHLLSERVLEAPTWDYENQKLGSTLAIRACRAAAKSKSIQQVARDKGGVTIREIMLWMNDRSSSGDSEFVEFETMMLTRINKKSFMMSIGKAIVRAGYRKNEFLSGRAFRWNLPKDIIVVDSIADAAADDDAAAADSHSLVARNMSMGEENEELMLEESESE
ncbi:hypothetical protein ACHAWU_007436 [Discostella pseudostelligera]|uniref:Uncharacterized protein n=1 Tax=Discostella pseudostelligera TaxID=259834 RepID=A0ABD3MS81_9STRA